MKQQWFVVVLLLVAAAAATEKQKSDKKHNKISEIEKKLDALLELEAELENEIIDAAKDEEEGDAEEEEAQDMQREDPKIYQIDVQEDPCAGVPCPAGRSCVVTMSGKGACQCVTACEEETDPRRRVCSNHNETWMTDCDLHRQRCLCEDGLAGCQDDKYKHLHIDYYGQCQQLPECEPEDLADFPRRMREWLFSVMRDMADRHILSAHYEKLEREAEDDETQKWSNAVVWKWCDLDGPPKDKVVSRHELFPLRAPLLTLEHCIAPFLDSCDPNDDHKITLKEWGVCLKLDEEDVADMDDLCEDIRDQEAKPVKKI
ncbi:SPARC [Hyalella azteca]|uniref:SPARC n=1 Tax=Hyalella azteca TaxID=294128 RepID=A0A8B7P9P5_HYAAZ|nr:SPARC [Hyalella azteca]